MKSLPLIGLLLSHKEIDVNQEDSRGWTPLRQACNRGDADKYWDLFSCFSCCWDPLYYYYCLCFCFVFTCGKEEDWPILNLVLQQPTLNESEILKWRPVAVKNGLNFQRTDPELHEMGRDFSDQVPHQSQL